MSKKEKILVIAASPNKKGNSYIASEWFLEGVDKRKYEVDVVYLYDVKINPFTNENRKALPEIDPEDKEIRKLITKVEQATKIVLTTPIWNFSVPSVLKSFIDRAMASGRVWSDSKQKKVPGWNGKTFYLIFTCGGPWYSMIFNRYAIGQLYWVLRYFGAKRKLITVIFNCGNGSECIINNRERLHRKLTRRGKKFFR